MRSSNVIRKTKETNITASMNIDGGNNNSSINTGVGFLDHMLTLFAKHGFFDLNIQAEGDLNVDCHHTVEDVGIVLGKLLDEAAGDRVGIARYGNCFLPMDETLAQVTIDFGGRPFLVFNADLPKEKIGEYDSEATEEFFRAVAFNCGMTLHINVIYGKNTHHVVEAVFKAFARALCDALSIDPRVDGVLSTKGTF